MKKILFVAALALLVCCGKESGSKGGGIKSITLDRTKMMLGERVMYHLQAKCTPANADVEFEWSSDNTSVAIVNPAGVVTGAGSGETDVRVKAGGKETVCHVLVCPSPEAVDLGFAGIKWASLNIGAATGYDEGNEFTWGSIIPRKMGPNPSTPYIVRVNIDGEYKERASKYCQVANYGLDGYTDLLTTLQTEDDAATQILGPGWRIPTVNEFNQLTENCNWTWMPGMHCFKLTSKKNSSNFIYLPITGHVLYSMNQSKGYYWSATVQATAPTAAYYYEIERVSDSQFIHTTTSATRTSPLYIRAVKSN